MKIETKLTLNNIHKNKKRTLYTTISILLCTVLIFTTLILISSIRNGITENFETEYNDYHFVLKDISAEQFNQIKGKKYIDKIYIQENNEEQLKQVDTSYTPKSNVTVYLKYKNIREVCKYTTDITNTLGVTSGEMEGKYEFNKKLLTVYGLIDIYIAGMPEDPPEWTMRVNFSYAIDIMILLILVAFSILFIIILYNAFLITINERKKEYAILNSVGGTEGQILKMIFLEAIIMGAIGIVIGGLISLSCSNTILNALNNTLQDTGYNFRLVLDGKYIILALIIIVINIYMSVLIPSVTASTTSVIQGVRGNKQIKHKKRKSILEKILPIEGKMAIRNIKRNKSKYRIITVLLVICMTPYIAVNTYIKYEKETANLVTEWDVDAVLIPNPTVDIYGEPITNPTFIDYKSILKDYEKKYGDKIEYTEYKSIESLSFLVDPIEDIMKDVYDTKFVDNKRGITMDVIGLDDKTYNKYIDKVNGKNGDYIIYNIRRRTLW